MVHYRVFLGAPSPSDIAKSPSSYVWKTTENTLAPSLRPSYSQYNPSVVYPPATLDAASRRVSLLYQNIIFKDADEEEEGKADEAPGYGYRESQEVDDRDSQRERTTFVTWPPTPTSLQTKKTTDSGNLNVTGLPTFLLPSQSQPLGTYETQGTASYAYSDDASSSSAIAHFPNFQFSLHTITSLSSIFDAAKSFARQQGSARLRRVNILVVILETEGPDTIKLKNGQDAGKEVSIFKMILGDEEGSVCRLTAWRDTADVWGGYGAGPDPPPAMKRGDVVYFESGSLSPASSCCSDSIY
ncbi:hypothetical protein ID866_8044 [Astraeus odoratus]|nr:hypothetical protein ID866_8044 [Astraeus odoratus]